MTCIIVLLILFGLFFHGRVLVMDGVAATTLVALCGVDARGGHICVIATSRHSHLYIEIAVQRV